MKVKIRTVDETEEVHNSDDRYTDVIIETEVGEKFYISESMGGVSVRSHEGRLAICPGGGNVVTINELRHG